MGKPLEAKLKRLLGLAQPDRSWFDVRSPAGAGAAHLSLRYLGTAGFVLEADGHAVALDPFVSRRGLVATFTRPLTVDRALVRRHIPRAMDVLVGHAHFDHVLDGPEVCLQTGARLIGSRAACMVGRAAGLPERQLVETKGREDLASGPWTVRGLPSIHGKAVLGRVPLPGDLTAPPRWPPRATALPHGLVLNWVIDTGGLRIAHIDSADFLPDELRAHPVDVLCLCAIGRAYRPRYTEEAITLLKPRWVVPCHWDTMVTPLEAEPDLLPGVDLPGFFQEIRAAGAEPLPVPLLGTLSFPRVR
jgi:L-ascorbate metabolism protein UlaG (beta-lactamase superfamily)